MKQIATLICSLVFFVTAKAQLYFPPNTPNVWDTMSPTYLGWCGDKIDSLYQFLDDNNTKAFILLKDGKIVLEKYFDGHLPTSNWYWASAGKTLTACLVGVAQQEHFLHLADTTATYLGQGWTNCTLQQEEKITLWHQLTMTSGLDDAVADPFCTLDSCLRYLADAGTRWAYHNAPYTLLDGVIEQATGTTLNLYTEQKVKNPTGMDGLYLQQGYNKVFFSTARSMARFGLLMLNKGNWNGTPILTDTAYFDQMVNTSQSLNEAYGYLWWLNGKNTYRIPQTQFLFSGSLNPNAPNDMIAALGKNGQLINVVPSENMVWIRMCYAPDNSLVPFTFNDDVWKYLNRLRCHPVSTTKPQQIPTATWRIYPNPAHEIVRIERDKNAGEICHYTLYNHTGALVGEGTFRGNQHNVSIEDLPTGLYSLVLTVEGNSQAIQLLKM